MRALTVTHAFGDYAPGDQITDKAAMKAALDTNPGHVVAVNMPKPDAPADAPKKGSKADDAKPATDPADPASSPSTAS
ncbi:hypothetical protein MKK88_01160 [Methylobacterium sp. E-005]|uniref:hypothetical protein n=1 Tax=Methylobacterium sp. E-005 TaxID=2836549 RepID=UPI001FBA41E8|nr:hypothetical protein [Methylobacterium sp. E-005]MCJ2084605.1 hypothetical protein [Methylobacterium sp. E-005]